MRKSEEIAQFNERKYRNLIYFIVSSIGLDIILIIFADMLDPLLIRGIMVTLAMYIPVLYTLIFHKATFLPYSGCFVALSNVILEILCTESIIDLQQEKPGIFIALVPIANIIILDQTQHNWKEKSVIILT
jgi:hypothetical protein